MDTGVASAYKQHPRENLNRSASRPRRSPVELSSIGAKAGVFLSPEALFRYTMCMSRNRLIILLVIILALGVAIGVVARRMPASETGSETNEGANINGQELANAAANASEKVELTGELRALALARDDKRLSDVRTLMTALEAYRGDNDGMYPTLLADITPDFLGTIPADPKTGEPYHYTPIGTGPNFYDLVYTLEIGLQGIDAGQHAATPSGIATP